MVRKHSRKREAVLAVLRSTESHPPAEWIYSALKPEYPDISLGTVYRNLSLFKRDGLIRSVGVIGGEERFDGDVSPHAHFVCSGCGRVLDVDDCAMVSDEVVAERNGVEIERRDITFYGRCADCKARCQ